MIGREALGEISAHWLRLAGATLGWGAGVSLFVLLSGLFVRPLESSFGWGRGEIALVSFILIGMGFAAPAAGAIADRIDSRIFIVSAGAILAGAYAMLAQLTGDIVVYFVILSVVALTAGPMSSPVIFSRLIVSHFDAARGLALAICLSGSTLIAAVMLPVTQGFIDQHGWRSAYLFVGAVTFGLSLASALMIGRGGASQMAPPAKLVAAAAAIVSDARFWLLALALGGASAGVFGLVSQLQPYLSDHGVPGARASMIGSVLALLTIAGRLTAGVLLDRLKPVAIGPIALWLPILGCLLLAYFDGPWLLVVAGFALVFAAQGAESDFLGYFAARYFGVERFGLGSGMLGLLLGLAVGAGGVAAGLMYDHFGDYEIFLHSAAIVMAISGLALLASELIHAKSAHRRHAADQARKPE